MANIKNSNSLDNDVTLSKHGNAFNGTLGFNREKNEIMKIEVDLPRGLVEAVNLICGKFEISMSDWLKYCIVSELEAQADNNFAELVEDEFGILRDKLIRLIK